MAFPPRHHVLPSPPIFVVRGYHTIMFRRGRASQFEDDNGEVSPRSRSKTRKIVQKAPASSGTAIDDDSLCEVYASNCSKLGLSVDPSVYIALQTGWDVMKPSSRFAEGDVQPLIGVLDKASFVRKLNLESTGMVDSRYRASGNGNSNARALVSILEKNDQINEINLRATGLDDDGLREVCSALANNSSITSLNLSANNFTEIGARDLEKALARNKTLKTLDLSNNQLGFESIQRLECSCKQSGAILEKSGNFVFEEILNSVSHGIAFILSIVGSVVLMNSVVETGHTTDYHYWACMVYSVSLVYLFLASTCYHGAFMIPSKLRDVLQVLDNIGIYMLIAGTYTPFLMIGMHNSPRGHFLLIFEWVMAALCSCVAIYSDMNDVFIANLKLASMLVMGGSCLIIWFDIMDHLPRDYVILLVIGGAGYLGGIPFFVMSESTPIYHTVWHLFVVFAATVHWFGTYWYLTEIDLKLGEGIDAWVEQATVDIQNPLAYVERVVQQKHL